MLKSCKIFIENSVNFNFIISGNILDVSYSASEIKHLNQLPSTDATVFFSCRHCQIFDLASAVFIDVPNIHKVDLSWNHLIGDVLRPDVLRGRFDNERYEPITIATLDLSHNRIELLDHNVFEHAVHLRALSLAYNPLNVSDPGTHSALGSIATLKHLDLSYIGMEIVPDELFSGNFLQLAELHLEGNHFTVLPDSITSLSGTLRVLNMAGTMLKNLNANSFKGLNKVTHLLLNDMYELKNIEPSTFAELTSLQVLSCRNNKQLKQFNITSLTVATQLREVNSSQ